MSLRWRMVGEIVPVGVEEPDPDGSPKNLFFIFYFIHTAWKPKA